jgi:hypothetical protein
MLIFCFQIKLITASVDLKNVPIGAMFVLIGTSIEQVPIH